MEHGEFNEIKRGLIAAYHELTQAEQERQNNGTQLNKITDVTQKIRVCAYYKNTKLRAAAETLLIYANLLICYDRCFFWGLLCGMERRADLTDTEQRTVGALAFKNMRAIIEQAKKNAVYCLKQLDNNGEWGKP